MYPAKRFVGLMFWISIAGWIFLTFSKPPLPQRGEIAPEVIEKKPMQAEIKMPPVKMTVKNFDYEITPLYEYEIFGVVVEEYTSDNFLDFWHKNDPAQTRDLCLVGGKSIASGAYREMKYSHGEFTCYYEWGPDMKKEFVHSELTNNHLLPKNQEVTALINGADIGDQVRIKGWLARYAISQDGQLISTRGTSTTREDMGNGSCETILVTDFEIVQEQMPIRKAAKRVIPYMVLISLILSVGLFFVESEPKEKTKITFDRV